MSKTFWTSDVHFNGNLRCPPFKSPEHYNERIITGINQRCKPEDTLFVVGDVVSYGNVGYKDDKGNRIVTESLRIKVGEHLKRINCKVILFEGNHCLNNGCKPHIKLGFVDVGRYLAFISHYPTDSRTNDLFDFREQEKWRRIVQASAIACQFALVGHVHTSPKIRWDTKNGLCNINLSPEVRNWLPISNDEIIREYQNFIKKA